MSEKSTLEHTDPNIRKGRGGARAGAGRPTLYSQELVDKIIGLMQDEGMNLYRISMMDGMPKYGTFWKWMQERPEFEKAYRAAEVVRAHRDVNSIEEIEWLVLQGELTPAQANFVVGSRRWRAKVAAPREFGDVTRTEIAGHDGGPLEVRDETTSAARIAALVAIALARRDRGEMISETDDLAG